MWGYVVSQQVACCPVLAKRGVACFDLSREIQMILVLWWPVMRSDVRADAVTSGVDTAKRVLAGEIHSDLVSCRHV